FANRARSLDVRERSDERAGADGDARSDDDVRSDADVAGDHGVAADLRARIDHFGLSVITLSSSASATSLPSTFASPRTLIVVARFARTVISMISWSPGTTGRRKRALSTPPKRKSFWSRSGMSRRQSTAAHCAIDSTM